MDSANSQILLDTSTAQIMEVILLCCSAKDLFHLCCTSRCVYRRVWCRRTREAIAQGRVLVATNASCRLNRFWARCDLVKRVTETLLTRTPYVGAQLAASRQRPARSLFTRMRTLAFAESCALAKSSAQAFALGTYHSAAILIPASGAGDAQVHTFGRGFHGQLGRGNTFEDCAAPVPVQSSGEMDRIVSIHCGGSHCAAVCDAQGQLSVHTWGLASSGELGHGGYTSIEVAYPRVVTSLMFRARVRAVCTGSNHTLVIGTCGGVWACGRGRHGQLGLGEYSDSGDLKRVDALKGTCIIAAAAGGTHSLALTSTGEVWTWGDARHGQLGQGAGVVAFAHLGDFLGMAVPQRALLPSWCSSDPVVDVVAGGSHSVMRTLSGMIMVCGRGRHGALGLQHMADVALPTAVAVPCEPTRTTCRHGAATVVAVAAGGDHTLALTVYGEVFATGCNYYGALGTGDVHNRTQFTRVRGLPPRVATIQAGEYHSAAACADGRLFTWGRGDLGQLGHGEKRSNPTPQALDGWRLAIHK